ncbi:MAG: nicotinate phosphoribosyltransferase [Alphaproteobacteria bacterium]|nr:nicotinate phosphoribosyltransferase [Alphaproteobacteria bacterium]
MSLADSPLLTDLYQLNMMAAYRAHGMLDTAVFELFVRKLPPSRGFLMAAGLEQVVQFLEDLRFTPDDLDILRRIGGFPDTFIDDLADFRFTGDVDALPEGTVYFPDEPVIRVVAPLPQAQLVETRIINLIHFQSVVASKAARMVLAAPGKQLIDFGLRRAHGAEAGMLAARASYLAGFAGSATTLAGALYGVPVFGTMAHSFIQAHDDETQAFEHFARARPAQVVLLIDTYDTEQGARRVVTLAPRLARDGIEVKGVRLDSGDLAAHARAVRRILDDGGLRSVRILASGGLDETSLAELTRDGAPIDGYGIGTSLTTSSDAPALDCAYKLQEYAGLPRRKKSEGKATWPGRKQVWRRRGPDGRFAGDTVATLDDTAPGAPLLVPVMRAGRRLDGLPTLEAARRHAAAQLAALPPALARLEAAPYPVTIAESLRRLADSCDRRTASMPGPLQ